MVTGATTLSIDQGVGTVTGTSVEVSPTATTTYTMTATNAAGSVTHSATVTIPAASLLFASATGGSGMLGEITEFPLGLTGTASTVHGFAGKPWIENHDRRWTARASSGTAWTRGSTAC